ERLPEFAVISPVDACLRIAAAVGGEGAGARRHVPAAGIDWVDGDRPGVVAVAALIGRLPGLACVNAEGGATATGLVSAARCLRVPGQRVHVRLRTGAMVLPACATVAGPHQS